MVARLIRIYTPFICAISALIHGVLSLCGYEGYAYYVLSDITGHSLLLLSYVFATSKRMCKWYKITCLSLVLIHVLNLSHVAFGIDYYTILYAGLVINIFAIIAFLVYRLKAGITKILC